MPKLCQIHSHIHKTEARSVKCRAKMMGYRADKAIQRSGALYRRNVDMVRHSPPRVVVREGVEYVVFIEDRNMQYGE